MTKREKAVARRERRAARGQGFSHYAQGIPGSSTMRAMRSSARAQERAETIEQEASDARLKLEVIWSDEAAKRRAKRRAKLKQIRANVEHAKRST